MAVAFRVGGQVVNGTAGTSVVVPNSGTSSGDQLIAYIGTTGAPTITPPTGWTLVQSLADGTNAVTLAVYRKLAGAEGATWTWTLGTSQRNYGWVGAYTGVDPSNPISTIGTDNTLTSSTDLAPTNSPLNSIPDSGMGVVGTAAVRSASGVATTWTINWTEPTTGTERADVSTNAGAGTDITGVVADTFTTDGTAHLFLETLVASQAQTAGVGIELSLNPYFVPLDPNDIDVVVEAAYGSGPDSDLTTVTWTDISTAVRGMVRLRKAAMNENGQADPSRIDFELNNPIGDFTPDNPASIYWPNIVLDTPIRVSLRGFGIRTYERATAFVDSWAPGWESPDWSVVAVSCGGRLQTLQEGRPPIRSAAYRTIVGNAPLDYWHLEDDASASAGGNAMPGGKPMAAAGAATFAGETTLPGSTGVIQMPTGAKLIGTVRRYAPTGQWLVSATMKLPIAVTTTTTLVEMFTFGTARRWRIVLVPGAPDEFRIRAYDSGETQILDNGFGLSGNVVEGDVYGKWITVSLGVTQNGANVDYDGFIYSATEGSGVSGTLNSRTHGNLNWVSVTATADMDGMGAGHVFVIVDPTFDTALDVSFIKDAILTGNAGESAWLRFQRLCQEENVPFAIQFTSTPTFDRSLDTVGAQNPGQLSDLLREVETLDAGILHDGGDLGKLVLSQRCFRYNKTVGLTLTGAQLMKDFKPKFDTQTRRGEVTASRPGGSQYVFAPSGMEGRNRDQLTVNTERDDQLPSRASWRSSRGQAKGMRYPQIGIDLRAHPELAKAWLASGVSTRVNITTLPRQHPSTTVDLFIDGYAEELDKDRWIVSPINCSPALPQGEVFQLESTTGNRGALDTAGSVLCAAVGTSDTTLIVNTTQGPRWTNANTPRDLDLGGEQVRATSITDPTIDAFNRSTSNGHGTSDIGIPWTVAGTASNYACNGTKATQSNTANNTRDSQLALPVVDFDFTVDVQASAAPTGAGYTVSFVTQAVAGNSFCDLRLFYATSGAVTIAVRQMVGGVETFAGFPTVSGVTATSNISMRFRAYGTTLHGKAWLAGGAQPNGWQVVVPRSFFESGPIILRSQVASGNTNGTVTFSWDNLAAANPQTMTVQRGLNGFTKSHAVGESVSMWQPSAWAL